MIVVAGLRSVQPSALRYVNLTTVVIRPDLVEVWSRHDYKSGLVARVYDGCKCRYCHSIGTCHDRCAVRIKVGSEHDLRAACLHQDDVFAHHL